MVQDRIDHLRHALGGPALSRLRARVRDHLAGGGDPAGTVTLGQATAEERRAVAALLGTAPSQARRLRVPLVRLSEGLQGAGLADSLAEALETLDGPIPDLVTVRAADDAAWAAVMDAAAKLDRRVPGLDGWAGVAARSGRLKRAAGSDAAQAMALLAQLERLLGCLPVAGGMRRARLAHETVGRAHALDPGTPLAGLAVEAVRALVGPPQLSGAEGVRETWASVGVLVDDLTSRVCVLNLPTEGDGPVDQVVRSAPGQPLWLTLRMLVTDPPRLGAGEWFACENLSVIAEAADVLGADSAPLVCVAGNPVVAVMRLLDLAARGGATVAYHGDFDWPGVGIAARVLDRLGGHGRPWRLGAADYEAALDQRRDHFSALEGTPVATPWESSLAETMNRRSVAVEEEAVIEALLADLNQSDVGPR